MRMSVTLDEKMLEEAKKLTKIENTQQLIRHAVKSMTSYEAVKYLMTLAGTEPELRAIPRRRMEVD